MSKISALLFLVTVCCPGQCPVKFIKVTPDRTQSWSRVGRSLTQDPKKPKEMLPDFSIRLQNASTKEIRGLKFQAAYFDATEDLHTIPVAWNWQPNMKAGSEKTLNQENPYSDTAVVGWVVVPIKVLFADGTKWEAPESDEDMKDGTCQ